MLRVRAAIFHSGIDLLLDRSDSPRLLTSVAYTCQYPGVPLSSRDCY